MRWGTKSRIYGYILKSTIIINSKRLLEYPFLEFQDCQQNNDQILGSFRFMLVYESEACFLNHQWPL